MKEKINVLIFPAGEINAIELHDSLATSVNIKLFGGSSVERHGSYVFRNYISDVPRITSKSFFQDFNAILKTNSIDIIFPTHDTIAAFFADNQDRIDAKVIVASSETAAICRDKRRTYELFADCDFVPRQIVYPLTDPLPYFIKPRLGAGSVGAVKIESYDQLDSVNLIDYVVNEYLPGEEYTVDCLTDKEGKVRIISPRSRDRTLAGISVSSKSQELTDEIKSIAEKINDRMTFEGLWFFQIKKDSSGRFKLLEIATRGAGTMCLTRAKGANLPLLSVYVALGYDVTPIINSFEVTVDRTLINRYRIDYEYEEVYLDFDDTVIIDGAVHPYSIMFIYQCHKSGKKIHLITKHEEDILKTLAKYCIDPNLFESIIHLPLGSQKSESIQPEKAIFVDNAFQERRLVYDEYKIPVFDVDALEVLLDWRV